MRLRKQHILFILICLCLSASPFFAGTISARDFIVVIDAGHGGYDPGAVGKISKEKDINLKVALKVGNLIKKNCKNVKVIYTRDKDVYVTLEKRAQIANEAKADLFISIHTNSTTQSKTIQGPSTWILGLHRTEANLEVAKRENSVILLESDYETRYAGFNPNSSESYIIFEFMQDKYMSQSAHLASLVQQQFKNTCNRRDRGVHQAGFIVLKEAAMPSILIELGFISSPDEEKYLNTDEGIDNMSKGIYQAFLTYKKENETRLAETVSQVRIEKNEDEKPVTAAKEVDSDPTELAGKAPANIVPEQKIIEKVAEKKETERRNQKEKDAEQKNSKPAVALQNQKPTEAAKTETKPTGSKVNNNEIIFKVQIFASARQLPKNDRLLKGISNAKYYREDNLYKYTYGETNNYDEVLRIRKSIAHKFSDAFIVAFKNGKKININTAINEYKRKNKQ